MTENQKPQSKRPNVLWICTDQQRFDTLGCYGNPFVKTPNLDRLAASGAIFDRAYCQNPLCTPSRASLLTGRYPRTTRARQNGQCVPAEETLVTRILDQAGYTCGLSGKLHLSPCDPRICPVRERRIDDGYSEFYWSHHPDGHWPKGDYNEWLRDHGLKYGRESFGKSRYVETSMTPEFHQTTWCAQKAIDFLEEEAQSGFPWLFSVNIYDPHHPFDPPLEFLQPYLDRLDEIPLPNYIEGELENKPVFQSIDHGGAYGGNADLYPFDQMIEADHRLIRAAYWAMCDLIDVQVGRLMDALEKSGQLENTIVIFQSDHGEMLGDHGIYLKGPHFYEAATRVPLIISWPGHIKTQRTSALVELVDIAPTLLDAVGLRVDEGMQGRSLWPLLTGQVEADHHRDSVYCEHYGTTHHAPDQKSAYGTMIRTHNFKLTRFHGESGGELYDLERDPDETHNLWCASEYQAKKIELLTHLSDRMAWTVDPLPVRQGPY
ncbi:MAG TPA: sulfatase-like hydrolase/transferase [Abditibacterium sp.]|jgi:choline-sulfatase